MDKQIVIDMYCKMYRVSPKSTLTGFLGEAGSNFLKFPYRRKNGVFLLDKEELTSIINFNVLYYVNKKDESLISAIYSIYLNHIKYSKNNLTN